MRKRIQLNQTTQELVVLMSEGNPGAMMVLMELLSKDEHGLIKVLSLDDMNMRGEQIYLAYKDFADCDFEKFTKAIHERSEHMVAVVNTQTSTKEMAVTSGGSWRKF